MKRRLLNLLTALSLLLCVAVAAMWARSHWGYDHVKHVGQKWGFMVISDRGLLIFNFYDVRNDSNRPGGPGSGWYVESLRDTRRPIHFYNAKRYPKPWYKLGLHPPRLQSSMRYWDAAIPDWLIVAITAVLPLGVLLRAGRRRRRLCASLCPSCGYDLRATPGRCPECGTSAKTLP